MQQLQVQHHEDMEETLAELRSARLELSKWRCSDRFGFNMFQHVPTCFKYINIYIYIYVVLSTPARNWFQHLSTCVHHISTSLLPGNAIDVDQAGSFRAPGGSPGAGSLCQGDKERSALKKRKGNTDGPSGSNSCPLKQS